MSTVTLVLAKEFLEISHSAQDNAIQAMLDGAEDWLARYLGVALASATRTEDLNGGDLYLLPNIRPVTALTSVVDLFSDDEPYTAMVEGEGRLFWADSVGRSLGRWPAGFKRFRAVYTGGFATMPKSLQLGVLMLTKRAYDARGGEKSLGAAGASMSWESLLGSDIERIVAEYKRKRWLRVG